MPAVRQKRTGWSEKWPHICLMHCMPIAIHQHHRQKWMLKWGRIAERKMVSVMKKEKAAGKKEKMKECTDMVENCVVIYVQR